jgi:hypothetical protein
LRLRLSKGAIPDGNVASPWEKLKNKYEPISAPSIFKLDKQSRESSLKKGQGFEIWINELEDLRVRLDDTGSYRIINL